MIRALLTASLLYNTYDPVSISKINTDRGNLIRYANCEWYNNRCVKNIEEQFPNLNKYNHITVNEINMNANILFKELLNCNTTILPIQYHMSNNRHHIIAYDFSDERYEIVSTPLTHNRTRIFIFSNQKDLLLRQNNQKST